MLQGLYFWEALALTLVPAALGVTAAWLLAGPLCRLSGWPQLAGSCALPLWQAAATTGALVIVSVLSAAGTAMSLAAEWPGELLQNGKE